MSRNPTATQSAFASLLTLLSILGATGGAVLATSAVTWLVAAPGPAQASSAAKADKKYWQKRYQELKKLVATLTQELEQARASYSRKRHDRRLRGDTRIELLKQIEQLETQLAKAERDLREFPDTARRAGALPGWFRDL